MTNTDWLTLALVIITAFYAWATLRILRANEAMVATMRAQQDAALRPYILASASVRTGTNLIYLSIRNVGKTAALGLRLSLDRSFYQLGSNQESSNLAKAAAFSQVIDSFPPDGHLMFLLGTGPTLFGTSNSDEISPLLFQVKAAYTSGTQSMVETSIIDLRPLIHTDIPHDPIVEELGKLRQELVKLAKQVEQRL